MIEKAYSRYCAIEEALEKDEELNDLKQQLQEASDALRTLMSRLTEDQLGVLTEYIGVCAEIDQRIVEIACFCDV